jgi:hypothetical protein
MPPEIMVETHARWLVHVDPRAIDVYTRMGVIEEFKLVGPKATKLSHILVEHDETKH